MWEKAATPEWTNAEVEFIKDVLNEYRTSKVFDILYITGRHCINSFTYLYSLLFFSIMR
ncbi:MAG: hypothetical protein ABJB05_00180 [Parafilimonas sp.]